MTRPVHSPRQTTALTVLAISCCFLSVVSSATCPGKAEEGSATATVLSFVVPNSFTTSEEFRWTADTFTAGDLVTCNATTRICVTADGYEQFLSGSVEVNRTSMVVQLDFTAVVRLLEVFNMETTWRLFGDGDVEIDNCDLVVFARPSAVTCDPPEFTSDNSSLTLTCDAQRSYPRAKCQFRTSTRTMPFDSNNIQVEYTHSEQPGNARYYDTSCTTTIPLSLLEAGEIRLFAVMYPDFDGSSPDYGRDPYVSPDITLSYPTVNIVNGTQCQVVSDSANNYKDGYIKSGANFSCLCQLTQVGNPEGTVQWLDQTGNIWANDSQLQVASVTRGQNFTCRGISPLGFDERTYKIYTPQVAYGPSKDPVLSLTSSQNRSSLALCPSQNLTIPVVCQTPVADVTPGVRGQVRVEKSGVVQKQTNISSDRWTQDNGQYTFLYDVTVSEAGEYVVVCAVTNSVFPDIEQVSQLTVTVTDAVPSHPVFTVNGSVTDDFVLAGDTVTVTCNDIGGEFETLELTCGECSQIVNTTDDVLVLMSVTSAQHDHMVCACEKTLHHSGCNITQTRTLRLREVTSDPLTGEDEELPMTAVAASVAAVVVAVILVVIAVAAISRKQKPRGGLPRPAAPRKNEDTDMVVMYNHDLYWMGRDPPVSVVVEDTELHGMTPVQADVVDNNISDIYNAPEETAQQMTSTSTFTPTDVMDHKNVDNISDVYNTLEETDVVDQKNMDNISDVNNTHEETVTDVMDHKNVGNISDVYNTPEETELDKVKDAGGQDGLADQKSLKTEEPANAQKSVLSEKAAIPEELNVAEEPNMEENPEVWGQRAGVEKPVLAVRPTVQSGELQSVEEIYATVDKGRKSLREHNNES